ncbi:MAG: DNA-processing protein DprA [Solirubrobacteraceae bacterium]
MGSHLDLRIGVLSEVLELDDQALIALSSKKFSAQVLREYERFGQDEARLLRERAQAAGVTQICRCEERYPQALRSLASAPAVLHVAGRAELLAELAGGDPVAVVGSRKATAYGLDVARMLGRGISASGLTVVSGLAIGVDGAAHQGALQAGGRTMAVIPGFAADAYPRTHRALHRRIVETGVVLSETGPGATVRRWMLPARNRIIAGLSRLTVLVQASTRSGAGITVRAARGLGRAVGAVPGSVLLEQSHGPNALLAQGAIVIRDAQDVLDAVLGAGALTLRADAAVALSAEQRTLLDLIGSGADTLDALGAVGYSGRESLTLLAGLELAGVLGRVSGGRYVCLL